MLISGWMLLFKLHGCAEMFMFSLEIMSISALRAMTKTQTTTYSWIYIYMKFTL